MMQNESYGPPAEASRSASDRRVFPRFDVGEGNLRAEVGGTGGLRTPATVVNISRGGAKLALQERRLDGVSEGACVVSFIDDAGQTQPPTLQGRIRRAGLSRREFYIAVEFSEPLETLDMVWSLSAA